MGINLQEIASKANVSRITVSRVINHHANVSPETRERVLEILKEIGYVPKGRRRESTNRKKIELLFYRGWEQQINVTPIYSRVMSAIQERLEARGSSLILRSIQASGESAFLAERIVEDSVDGLILFQFDAANQLFIQNLQTRGIPLVMVQPRFFMEGTTSVTSDNYQGGLVAVSHLIAQGHRRIAHIQASELELESVERQRAYAFTLREAGLEARPEYCTICGDWSSAGGYKAMGWLMGLDEPPTAVFAADDTIAVGAINYCAEHGIKVPDTVSVIGFDDLHPERFTFPALTTIHYDATQLGQIAIQQLMGLIEDPDSPPCRILTPTSLVQRASVKNMVNHPMRE